MLVGGLFLLAVAFHRRSRFTVARSLPGTTLLLGASVALYQGCYFSGISRLGVAMGSIVTVATVPVATGIVAYLLRKEKPVGRWYVATALAIAGLIASSGAVGETRADLLGFIHRRGPRPRGRWSRRRIRPRWVLPGLRGGPWGYGRGAAVT